MNDGLRGALEAIEEAFGERLKREPGGDGGARRATVLPRSASEVELLARVAERHGVPLVALGAGTAGGERAEGLAVRFDLMRGVKVRGDGETWVRAEPGASWLELEEALGTRGWGLAVYPTSAPKATVGGWLAEDGIGVGSFRYGRTRENVLSADVVSPGGRRRTVGGEELGFVLDGAGNGGVVVAATLRTRRADDDVPFAIAFSSLEDLAEAAGDVHRAGAPLWHLSLLSAEMARARGFGDDGLLFGAYPAEHEREAGEALRETAAACDGAALATAGAYRVWGQRFFPVAPARPAPVPADRTFVSLADVPTFLRDREGRALQGTVARSGEVLILDLGEGAAR